MKFGIILLVFSLLLVYRCTPSDGVVAEPLSFSLEVGDEAIYDIIETNYVVNENPTTSLYFLRDVTVEATVDGVNKSYKIERYRRNTSSEAWKITRVITLSQTPAELIESGEKMSVKLNFPVVEAGSFNVNRYNNSGTALATYKAVDKPFRDFLRTFSVVQANDSTLIDLKREVEVYAAGNGLVYKENTQYAYCQSSPDCIGKGQISFGKSVVWRRIN